MPPAIRLCLAWLLVISAGLDRPATSMSQRSRQPAEMAQGARDVLERYCYRCHGQEGRDEGGFNVVVELEQLVASRWVVPGEPDRSKLLRMMVEGRMPPETDVLDDQDPLPLLPRPAAAEIALVRDWVAAGAPPFPTAETPRQFVTELDVLLAIRDDLRTITPRHRRFTRYATITHLYNAGYTEDQLQTYRLGLNKLVNSLSWGRRVVVPKPVDPARTVMRLDLRDYLWNDEVWTAIQAQYPYGILHGGATAAEVYEEARTELPAVRADWLVFAASRPPLYHEVLRLPESLADLEWKLNVDAEANIAQERVARAGFSESGISRNNRLIERHESSFGAYWKSYDFAGNTDRRNLFAYPLGPGLDDTHAFQHDGGEAIFDLPNGLHAYLLVDGDGNRIDRGPTDIVRDPKQSDGAVLNGISCMSCHARGFIEKADQMRGLAEKTSIFDRETVETLLTIHPTPDEWEALIREDNARFAAAVEATGAPLGRTEPVHALAQRFEQDLDLTVAAAEADLSPDGFRNLLKRNPEVGQSLGLLLVGGTVKRDAYIEAFPSIVVARRLEYLDPLGFHDPYTAGVRQPLGTTARAGYGGSSSSTPARRPGFVPPRDDARWVVLFRGRDPQAWNTHGNATTHAVPIAQVPPDMQYLRLRRMDTGEAILIPLTHDRLLGAIRSEENPGLPYRWCGTNEHHWGGYHLGISEGKLVRGFDKPAGAGQVAVQVQFVDFFAGSGFGHVAHGDTNTQAFGWRGTPIPPTDFEIAVSRGPLNAAEKRALDALMAARGGAVGPGRSDAGGTSQPAMGHERPFADLPETLWNDRDGFRDFAPKGGTLIGFNVTFSEFFGNPTIGSIEPIYSVGRGRSQGPRRGNTSNPMFPPQSVVAKPGYAVGGFHTRTGLTVDGFDVIFMRIQGDRLDPNDSYNSPWFGNTTGGGPGFVSTDGRMVIGIQGSAEQVLNRLGLMVAP